MMVISITEKLKKEFTQIYNKPNPTQLELEQYVSTRTKSFGSTTKVKGDFDFTLWEDDYKLAEQQKKIRSIKLAKVFLGTIDKEIFSKQSSKKTNHEKTMKKYSIIKFLRDRFNLTYDDIKELLDMKKESIRWAYEHAEYVYVDNKWGDPFEEK